MEVVVLSVLWNSSIVAAELVRDNRPHHIKQPSIETPLKMMTEAVRCFMVIAELMASYCRWKSGRGLETIICSFSRNGGTVEGL